MTVADDDPLPDLPDRALRQTLAWVLWWRRPAAERQTLEKVALAHQPDKMWREEIQAMSHQLGPTLAQVSMAQGEAQGKLLSTRTLLRALLEDRFGAPLPEELVGRIEGTEDLDRLQTAARQVYRVPTIADVPI